MEFGFSLPSRDQAATMQNMRLLAQHGEALGLDSVWVSDRIIVPRQIDSFSPLRDGWHPIGLRAPASLTPPEMREAVARLRDEASQAGRNPQDITISFRAPLAFDNAGGASRQPLTGSPAAIQDDIGRYADCGVSHMVFDIMTADVAEMQRVMERFTHDVKRGVRA